MLKRLDLWIACIVTTRQPPSGGCVLKLSYRVKIRLVQFAATFGWLCVETFVLFLSCFLFAAATFGWLCVETQPKYSAKIYQRGSHLRVAVC